MKFRIGYGYDLHRLVTGRPLIVGGIEVPFKKGLAGHSDADVLLHSITDAMLGALALGDIGTYFPDTDPVWEGADSSKLLKRVHQMIRERKWVIQNIDSTIIAELPKFNPHVADIRKSIANMLGMEFSNISVKATTNEKLGYIGNGEGIAAHAVILLMSDER
jgi:2-C-methyl-D-erythritol 2,4-cyclodiphosphate synthase